MASTSKTKEEIFISVGDERIELTGANKDAFLADRATMQAEADARKAEADARKEARISALQKLGLTEEEINAIL